jgi:hypothetical protein
MKLIMSVMLMLWLCFPYVADAYTKDDTAKTAASDGSLPDTQNALSYINGRNEDGWTLTVGVPGNTYNWSSALQIPAGHTITVQGAGTYSPDTRPTVNFTHSQGSAISFSATNGKVVRITNFKFTDSGSPVSTIQVNGWSNVPSWRVDHNRFENMADRVITVGNQGGNAVGGIGPYGLADNNWFESTGNAYRGLYLFFGSDGNSWRTSHSFGTDKTIVVEDNVFNRTGSVTEGLPAIDSAHGARWLMRYNTLNNWVAVLHGPDSAPVSTLQFEFNHNTVRVINDGSDYALYIRGGTGVAMGNDIGVVGNPNQVGYNSAWKMVRDGPCSSGYPCFQQVGRGVVNGAEGSVPLYFWNNIYNLGGGFNGAIWSTESSSDIQLNRDFFLSAKPGYTELVYPHPLRNAQTGGNPPPAIPQNIRVF